MRSSANPKQLRVRLGSRLTPNTKAQSEACAALWALILGSHAAAPDLLSVDALRDAAPIAND